MYFFPVSVTSGQNFSSSLSYLSPSRKMLVLKSVIFCKNQTYQGNRPWKMAMSKVNHRPPKCKNQNTRLFNRCSTARQYHGEFGCYVPVHLLKKSNFSRRILRRNSTKATEYLQKLGWYQRIITMTGTTESAFHHELTLPRPYARLLHPGMRSQSLPLTPYRAVKMRELYKIISWHGDDLSTYLQAKNWGLFNTFQ